MYLPLAISKPLTCLAKRKLGRTEAIRERQCILVPVLPPSLAPAVSVPACTSNETALCKLALPECAIAPLITLPLTGVLDVLLL